MGGDYLCLKEKNEILGRLESNVKFPLWWGYEYFLDLHVHIV